jgi:hypothetical protein
MSAALFGVVAAASLGGGLYLLWLFARKRQLCDLFVSLGLMVLAALSILLAAQGLEALKSPLAAPLGVLVPLLISLGVVKAAAPRYWKWYGVFVVVGLVVIAALRPAVPVIHAVAGLVIFLLPIYAVLKKAAPVHFIGVAVGGVLIGVGGLALASAIMARPILPLELVVALLPWILLLMAVFYIYGFAAGVRR